ncbi:hypothetical protein K435DRAFT_813591 [Dendrothele bispora CBS 962.96]|uniref:Uncharacterized protein n=1 Tax=Dendrothele bispora (strain CBS 962.96) TaxID=1314807 RepID=A0A4S8KM05_DENBC|nr:hypothetical protein K435DRAFT_813591 [Dendrothele bispora CBS 962.96]
MVDFSTHIQNNYSTLEVFGVTLDALELVLLQHFPKLRKLLRRARLQLELLGFLARKSVVFRVPIILLLQETIISGQASPVGRETRLGSQGFPLQVHKQQAQRIHRHKVEIRNEETHLSVTADLDLTRYLQVMPSLKVAEAADTDLSNLIGEALWSESFLIFGVQLQSISHEEKKRDPCAEQGAPLALTTRPQMEKVDDKEQ